MTTHNIIIYGPGCARCEELELRTRQAVNALSGQYTVRHEHDAAAMAAAGVLATPALALDGKLLISGKVPNLRELQELLLHAVPAAQPAAAERPACCCGGTCGTPLGAEQKPEPACGCGGTCGAPRGGVGKKVLLWAVVALVAVGGIKYINRQQRMAAESPAVTAPAAEPGLRAVYYTFGPRCVTCVRMETWARETIETRFARELADGTLGFETQEADAAAVQEYGLTTKSLMLHRGGEHPSHVNLTRIWELSRDEAAFKDYVEAEIKKFLDAHE